ncbi:uncharacterized protein DSM5745_09167 [Aspergillus mulundensis]|uniref:Uncharacterized protein n=1 Tax=Aspergillus mulundensis TaxID=1810919 RepID=A0A3D8R066_9EURO|nr:hypothetical protein DSM5745_09167 [Aspergillus mulundensis]RDW67301.1 hypothetical protein DSM5745_09167 [Aspergillus mulundensis]
MTPMERNKDPVEPGPEGHARYLLKAKYAGRPYSVEASDIVSVTSVLAHFRELDYSTRPSTGAEISQPKASQDDILRLEDVNASSLAMFAQLRIHWVDDLPSHLHFDKRHQTLSVFKYPTLCARYILKGCENGISKLALLAMDGRLLDLYQVNGLLDLYREVMLSYKLLFSTPASQRLLKKELAKLKHVDHFLERMTKPHNNGEGWDLESLSVCGRSRLFSRRAEANPLFIPGLFPQSVKADDGQLLDLKAFSVRGDLPRYGSRFLTIRDYTKQQEPNTLKGVFWDQRAHWDNYYWLWFG